MSIHSSWFGDRVESSTVIATDGHTAILLAAVLPGALGLIRQPVLDDEGEDFAVPKTGEVDALKVWHGCTDRLASAVPVLLGESFALGLEVYVRGNRSDGEACWFDPAKVVFLRGCTGFTALCQCGGVLAPTICLRDGKPVGLIMPVRTTEKDMPHSEPVK